jgi:peroxiredoxin
MTELSAPTPTLGWHPSDFALEGTDGRRYRIADVRGAKGTLVMFICNHCPYVQAVLDDIIRDVRELKGHGIGAIGIMPNDVAAYPADSFENMTLLAEAKQLPFPYVIDGEQEVARAFGAVCTPDFFGFNADLELQYRGRIYAVRNLQRISGSGRELYDAMVQIAQTSRGPVQQNASMGCSIKWRH